jgi:sugar/nucleoside kinase (ribokinase family)
MSTHVGVIGGLSIDHLVNDPAGARFNCLGGPGLYATLGARLVQGTTVRLLANLPTSTAAFTEVLTGAGVDLNSCHTTPDVPRVWILASARGRRLVPIEPPPGSEFGTDDETADEHPMPAADADFFSGLSGVLYCSPDRLSQSPTPTLTGVDPDQRHILDRGEEYWQAITARPGILLPSRVQLATVASEPRAAARALARRLRVDVAARLDVDGIYAVDATGAQWLVQDSRVDAVDTTGAGDTSAGAIVAARAAGADLPTAAAFGVSAARIVLSDWGHDALLKSDHIASPLDGVRVSRQ